MKLHLGSSDRLLPPPWVNVDLIEPSSIREGYDFTVGNVINLEQFGNDTIDEIYASHVLDHMSRNKELDKALDEWYSVLKPGGILRIAVSDFDKVVKMYNEGLDLERLWGHIVGGHKSQFDKHGCSFNFVVLRRYLEKHGFVNVKRYRWQDFLPDGFDDLSRCFIPHLSFDDGILMSLNVIAQKPA